MKFRIIKHNISPQGLYYSIEQKKYGFWWYLTAGFTYAEEAEQFIRENYTNKEKSIVKEIVI